MSYGYLMMSQIDGTTAQKHTAGIRINVGATDFLLLHSISGS